MIMNNNRLEDFETPAPLAESPPETRHSSVPELAEYATLAKEWAQNNPVPCLAAAFVAGAAIAWIFKRK